LRTLSGGRGGFALAEGLAVGGGVREGTREAGALASGESATRGSGSGGSTLLTNSAPEEAAGNEAEGVPSWAKTRKAGEKLELKTKRVSKKTMIPALISFLWQLR
jgi:hypothetical protein